MSTGNTGGAQIRLPLVEGKDIRFTHLSTEDGLSQSRVEHIIQDDQGFMWFGTQDGLSRYDGYTFKSFRHDPKISNSLSGTEIRALFKDRSGALWIGVDQFLDRFDPVTETFAHYQPEASDSSGIEGSVYSICQDYSGALWLATSTGLNRLEPATGRFTHYGYNPDDPSSLSSNDLTYAMQGRNGILWVASTAGLDAFDPQSRKVTRYLRFDGILAKLLHPDVALRPDIKLYEDRAGLLWITSTSGSGLASFDRETRALTRYSFDKEEPDPQSFTGVTAVYEDDGGTMWLATVGSGLVKFDRRLKTFTSYRNKLGVQGSISNNFVLSLYEDREGSIWAGTGGGGINRFPRRPLPFVTYRNEPDDPNSLDQNFVISVFQDSQATLWIGNDGVLNHYDPRLRKYSFYRGTPAAAGGISDGTVTSTVEDRSGILWFGTYGGGLNRFDRKTGRFKAYRNNPTDPRSLSSDHVTKLFLDGNGRLWIATGDGLDRFDPKSETFTTFLQNLPSPINQIVQDPNGDLWLGTVDEGLSDFVPATGQFTAYKHDPRMSGSLSNNHVNSICLDKSGMLWVGTQDGLDRFDRTARTFTATYYESDGLPNNTIQGIQEDDEGNLWLSTNNGLSRFQPNTGGFRNFYDSDGLAGNDFGVFFPVSYKSPSGELFFGGANGITAFYPEQLAGFNNSYVPPIVLTDFRLFNDPVSIGPKSTLKKAISYLDSLTLSHNEDIFSLEFSALSYFSPARNHYRYKLEGLSNEWYEAASNHRFVTYTTLPPGDYIFRVQGSNNDGAWNDQGTSIRIRILPPWWGTWWFRLSSAGLLLFLVWAMYYYRVNQLSHQFAIRMEERVNERTRIAQDLHDTLLQGFLSASMQLHVAADQLPADSSAKPLVNRVLELMGHITEEGRNALQGLRSPGRNSHDLEEAFARIPQEFAVQEPFDFRIIVDGQPRPIHPIIRDEIYRTGREALVNAFRHSRAASIEVELGYTSGQMQVTVRDDGCGIDPHVLRSGREGHWGLSGMRERAEAIGAKFKVWSRPGGGTEVALTIPGYIAFESSPKERRSRWKARLYPRKSRSTGEGRDSETDHNKRA